MLRFEGLESLDTKNQRKRFAELKLCLTARECDDGIIREEREDGSSNEGQVPRAWGMFHCDPGQTQADPTTKATGGTSSIRFGLGLDPPDRHGVKLP